MKNFIPRIAFALAGVLAWAALPAHAGHDEEEGDPLFDRVDANGDGHLTRTENMAGARRLFVAMDANHDGFLTAAEMDAYRAKQKDAAIRFSASTQPSIAGRDPGSGAARADGSASMQDVANARGAASAERDPAGKIRTGDRDGDGRLSPDEYEAAAAAMFDRLDADHDGLLSRAECAAGTAL